MFLMISLSCKHVVNGSNIKVIEPTTKSIFMKKEKGEGGIQSYQHKNKFLLVNS